MTGEGKTRCDDGRERPDLRCPSCGGPVASTGSGPAWMNSDQWDSVKAGDYYCEGTCTNAARENGLVYFWADDVRRASVCEGHRP